MFQIELGFEKLVDGDCFDEIFECEIEDCFECLE